MKEIHIPGLPASSDLHRGEVQGTLTIILQGHTSSVFDAAFSPDDVARVDVIAFSPRGNLLASAVNNDDRALKLWDTATGKELQTQSPRECRLCYFHRLLTRWKVTSVDC
ncbi:hypothetical protein GMDG_06200 [Pseudogymnoascus destructans 20631-21]|uniref:Anaphase-promoting complex subunit 4 WD40 domain-containing protein n=1 Tax=Pseudogymnoascus destructans (strain ATCC MYA-4855 / 20631-21) TaxID=658429 RepID=L8FR61_PSED2|nr:hypothetical protein GMDG_06200 [Pseudogymnoascus destructans 20631-21]